MTRAFAELAAFQIQAELTASRSSTEQRDRILHVIEGQRFSFLYQPVWDFGRNRPAGFECLSRFPGPPFRTPDLWFEEAAQAGLGAELELAVFTAALHAARDLLDEIYVSFNLSPEAILSADFPPRSSACRCSASSSR